MQWDPVALTARHESRLGYHKGIIIMKISLSRSRILFVVCSLKDALHNNTGGWLQYSCDIQVLFSPDSLTDENNLFFNTKN